MLLLQPSPLLIAYEAHRPQFADSNYVYGLVKKQQLTLSDEYEPCGAGVARLLSECTVASIIVLIGQLSLISCNIETQ